MNSPACLLHPALTLRKVSLQILARLIEDICHLDSHSQHIIPCWSKQITVLQETLCTLVTHQVCNAKADHKPNFQESLLSVFPVTAGKSSQAPCSRVLCSEQPHDICAAQISLDSKTLDVCPLPSHSPSHWGLRNAAPK